jgi:hypothetical protein
MPMPAAGAAHALRRRLVYGHRLAPQGSRFIPENPSDRVCDRRTPGFGLQCSSGPWALLLRPAIGEQGKKILAGRSGTESRKSRENVPEIGKGV